MFIIAYPFFYLQYAESVESRTWTDMLRELDQKEAWKEMSEPTRWQMVIDVTFNMLQTTSKSDCLTLRPGSNELKTDHSDHGRQWSQNTSDSVKLLSIVAWNTLAESSVCMRSMIKRARFFWTNHSVRNETYEIPNVMQLATSTKCLVLALAALVSALWSLEARKPLSTCPALEVKILQSQTAYPIEPYSTPECPEVKTAQHMAW